MISSKSLAELRITAALGTVALLLRVLGVRRTISVLDRLARRAAASPVTQGVGQDVAFARRVAARVNVTARRMPGKPRCLVRSLATTFALRRHGLDARLHVGVAFAQGFAAHAWVELHGQAVSDLPDATAAYRPLWQTPEFQR